MFGRKRIVERPVIFVDVDGTLSPNQYESTSQDDYFFSSWNGGHYFPLRLRKELLALPAEKIWLTGWGEDAEDTFSCGWQTIRRPAESNHLWKYEAIEAYLSSHAISKIVWFDDEIASWQDEIPNFSVPALKISPLIAKGLSEQHLLLARKFLNE